jgi:hypothetical protein
VPNSCGDNNRQLTAHRRICCRADPVWISPRRIVPHVHVCAIQVSISVLPYYKTNKRDTLAVRRAWREKLSSDDISRLLLRQEQKEERRSRGPTMPSFLDSRVLSRYAHLREKRDEYHRLWKTLSSRSTAVSRRQPLRGRRRTLRYVKNAHSDTSTSR